MAKSITLNISLKWPEWPGVQDDYVVRYEGHLIGRKGGLPLPDAVQRPQAGAVLQ